MKFIDLFAGIGGFHLALSSLGGKCVYASEWDKKAQETYNINHNILPEGDITKISPFDIPPHDVICAGFPCQAFSISGRQQGFGDTRGTLFFDVARIAKYHQPKVLFLENVKHLIKHDNGDTFKVILETLNTIGYDVFYKVLDSSNFGVPQKRQRVYIVAFRKDLGIKNFNFPQPDYKQIRILDVLQPEGEVEKYSLRRSDYTWWDNDVIEDEYLNKLVQLGFMGNGNFQGRRIYDNRGFAPTLTTSSGVYIKIKNNGVRELSPRELARLNGFPDTFILSKYKTVARKQLGNSVVVPVIKEIYKRILKSLSTW